METIDNKINHIVAARSNLFDGIDEDINERLDRLISIIEDQATQIVELKCEHNQVEEKHRSEIGDLQK